MTVSIVSGIPVYAGPSDIVTSIIAPNIVNSGITIADITGLQAALDTKLEDVIGAVAPNAVSVTVTGDELNYLIGATSNIQSQLDGKLNLTGGTLSGNLAFGVAFQIEADAGMAAAPGIATVGDLDTGIYWPADNTIGISVGSLDAFHVLPSGLLQSQVASYEALVLADNDIPNKKYVDDEIALAVGGPFLPLAGGTMIGDIDLDGVASLVLDADGNTRFEATVDDTVNLWVGGVLAYFWNATSFDAGSKLITNVLDPVSLQDAATKNYVDTEITALGGPFLELAGGTMTGAINMGATQINNMADPTLAQDAVTLAYADATYMPVDGSVPATGDLDAGGNNIINVADPVNPQDAATMAWVDANFLNIDGSVAMTGNIDMGGNLITNLADATAADEAVTLGQGDARYVQIDGSSTMTGALDLGTNQINNVVDPTLAQDAATKNYADTTFLDLAGTSVMTGALDMGTNLISNVVDPVAAQDAATMNYVDTEITALGIGGATGPFLELAGTSAMTGALDMGTNLINNVVDPVAPQDAATMNYVDTEIAALSTGVFLPVAGGTMTGDLITDTGVQISADGGGLGAPSYAFTSALDTGMWYDGTNLRFGIGGASALTVAASGGDNEVDVHGRQVVGVADPTAADHAVTRGYLEAQNMVKLLGSVSGVDLLATGVTPIYTIPAGSMHIVTQVIVRATTYTPGGAPTNPIGSVGLSGNYEQIVVDTTLDWGGTAGAGDQVVYLQPKDGADSPNAGNTISFEVDTAGGGTFSALTATIYVLGIEL